MLHEASLYDTSEDLAVRCRLCAHYCTIPEGKRGVCRVRENREGRLYSLVYGKLVAANVDPIEKKPLYHFHPGSLSYSIATAGCNMSCLHCQNYRISMEAPRLDPIPGRLTGPEEVVREALRTGCGSISYTYTEPTIAMEFARDCAVLAREKGLSNVFVTNGFLSIESLDLAAGFLDAANIDLKGASEDHYRTVCRARLEPVLETIRGMHEKGVWIEITTLLIPGLNDDETSLDFIASFIASVDPAIPWHVSRFFPTYRMTDRPPTPLDSLQRAQRAGKETGLKHIYMGNVQGENDRTLCAGCGSDLIERRGYGVSSMNLTKEGACPACGRHLEGVFLFPP